jgi:hypothetical protein
MSNVQRIPRIDWLAVALEATHEQLWYMELQPALDNVSSLVFDKTYQKQAGRLAVSLWRQWLEAVANGGRVRSNYPWLRTLRFNVGTAIIGYKLTSVLVQPLALAEAMAFAAAIKLKKASVIGLELRIALNFLKSWVNPLAFSKDKAVSDMLKLREGGDFAVKEGLERLQGNAGSLLGAPMRIYQRFSYSLIKQADLITATGVRTGIYKTLIKEGYSPEQAAVRADFLMNIVSGSSEVADSPLAISTGGEPAKLFLMFKNFALNSWGIIWHDLIVSGLWKGGIDRKFGALIGLLLISFAKVLADILRDGVRGLIDPKSKKKNDRVGAGRLWDFLLTVPEAVPLLGDALQSMRKYNMGGFTIPVVRVVDNIFSGAFGVLNASSPSAKTKNQYKVLEGVASLFGIAGTTQLFDLLGASVGDERGSSSAPSRVTRPSRGGSQRVKRPTR